MANNFDNYLSMIQQAKTAGAVEGTADYFNQENRQGVRELTKTPRTGNPLLDSFLRAEQAQANIEAKRELPTSYLDDASAAVSSVIGNTAQTAHGFASLAEIGLSAPARDHYIREVQNSEAYKNADPETQQAMLAQAEADMARSEANMYRNIAERSESIDDVAKGFMTPNAQREMEAAGNRAATLQNIAEQTNASFGDQLGLGIRSAFQNPTQAVHTTTGVLSDFMTGGLVNKGADLAIDATKAGMRAATGYLGRQEARKAAREAGELAQERTRDVIAAKADEAAMARRYGDIEREYTNRHLGFNTPNQDEAVARIFGRNAADEAAGAQYKAAQEFAKEMAEDARNAAIKESNDEVKGFLKRLGGTTFVESLAKNKILDTAASFTRNPMVRWAGRRLREGAGVGVVEGLQTASEGFGQVQQELDRITDQQFLNSQAGSQLFNDEYEKLFPLVQNGSIGTDAAFNLALENARARAANEAHTNYMATAPLMNATIQTAMGATVPSIGRALNPLFRGSGAGANLTQAASEVVQEGLSGYGSNELMRRFINPYGGQVSSASGFVAGQEAAGGLVAGAPHAARGSMQAATNLAASAGRGMINGYRALRPQKQQQQAPQTETEAKPQPQPQPQPQPTPAENPDNFIQTLKDIEATEPELKQTAAVETPKTEEPEKPETPKQRKVKIDDSALRDFKTKTPEQQQVKDNILEMIDDLNQDDGSGVEEKLDKVNKRLGQYEVELDIDDDGFYDAVSAVSGIVGQTKTAYIEEKVKDQAAHTYNMVKNLDPSSPARIKVFKALIPMLKTSKREDIPFTEGELLEIIHDKTNYDQEDRAAATDAFINKGYIDDMLHQIVEEADEGFGHIKETANQKLTGEGGLKPLNQHVADILKVLKKEKNLESDRADALNKDTQLALRHLIGYWLSQETRQQAFENTEPNEDGARKLTGKYISYNPRKKAGHAEGRFFMRSSENDSALPEAAYESMARENDGIRQVLSVINAITNARSNKNKGLSPIFQQTIKDIVDKSDDPSLDKKALREKLKEFSSLSRYLPDTMNFTHRDTRTLAKSAKQEDEVQEPEQEQKAAPQAQSVEPTPAAQEVSAQNQEPADEPDVQKGQDDEAHVATPQDNSNQAPQSSSTQTENKGQEKKPDNDPQTYNLKDVPFSKIGEKLSEGEKKSLESQLRDISRNISTLDFETEEELVKRITHVADLIEKLDNSADKARAIIFAQQKMSFDVNPEESGLGHLSDKFKINFLDSDVPSLDIDKGLVEVMGNDRTDQIQALRKMASGLQDFLNDLINKSPSNQQFIKDLQTEGSNILSNTKLSFVVDNGLRAFSRVTKTNDGLEVPYTVALASAIALEMTRHDTYNREGGVLFTKDRNGEMLWDEIPDKEKEALRGDEHRMDVLARAVTEQSVVDIMARNIRDVLGLKQNNAEAEGIVRTLAATVLDYAVTTGGLERTHVVYKEQEGNKAAAAHIYFSVPEMEFATENEDGVAKRPLAEFLLDNELINKLSEEGEEGRKFIVYTGEGKEPEWRVKTKYKRNTRVPLSDEDIENLENDAKIKFYVDNNMYRLFKDLDFNKARISAFLQKMLGLSIPVNEIGQPIGNFVAIESTKSKINEVDRAVELAIEIYKQYEEAGEPAAFHVRFPSDMTITNRLQTLEHLSPRNNKVMRACFNNARCYAKDLTDKDNLDTLPKKLAVAQAFGQKIEKMTKEEVEDFYDKVTRVIDSMVKDAVDDPDSGVLRRLTDAPHEIISDFYHAHQDIFDKPSMLGYAVLEELVQESLWIAGEKADRPKYSYLYIEIDGKTNGAHNMLHFQSYKLTPDKVGALLNTGTTFGSQGGAGYFDLQTNEQLKNVLGGFTCDIYEATAKITGETLKKFADEEERSYGRSVEYNRFWNAFAMTMRAWGKGDAARSAAYEQYKKDERIELQLRRADLKYPTTAANYGASAKTMVRHMVNESEDVLVDGFNDFTIKFREAMIEAEKNNTTINADTVLRQIDRDKYAIVANYTKLGKYSFFKYSNGDVPAQIKKNKKTSGYPDNMPIDINKFKNRYGIKSFDLTKITPEQAHQFYEFLQNWDVLHSDLALATRQNIINFAGEAMEIARTRIMGSDVKEANDYESGSQNRNVLVRMAMQDTAQKILDGAISRLKKTELANKRIGGALFASRNAEDLTPDFIDNMVRLKYLSPEEGQLLKDLTPFMAYKDTTLTYGRTEMVHNPAYEIRSLYKASQKQGLGFDERPTLSMMTNTNYKNVGVSGQAVATVGGGDGRMVGLFNQDEENIKSNASTVYDGVNFSANSDLVKMQQNLNKAVDNSHQRLIMAPLFLQNLKIGTEENINLMLKIMRAKYTREEQAALGKKFLADLEVYGKETPNPNPILTPEYIRSNEGFLNLLLMHSYMEAYDKEGYDSFVETQRKAFERKNKNNPDRKFTNKDINTAAMLNFFLQRYDYGVRKIDPSFDTGADILIKQMAFRLAKYFAGYQEEQMTAVSVLGGEANFVRKGYNGNSISSDKNSPELQSDYLNYLANSFIWDLRFELEEKNGQHPFLVKGGITPQDADRWFANHAETIKKTKTWEQFFDYQNKPASETADVKIDNPIVEGNQDTYELAEFFDTAKLRDALRSSDLFRDNKLLKQIVNPARLRGIKLVLTDAQGIRFKHGIDISDDVVGVSKNNYIYINLNKVGSKPGDSEFTNDVAEVVYHELIHAFTAKEIEDYFVSPTHYKKLYGQERAPLMKEYVDATKNLYQKLLDNRDLVENEIELLNAGLTAAEAAVVHSFFNNTVNQNMDARTFAIEYVAYAASIPDLIYGINKLEKFNFQPKKPLMELLARFFGFFKKEEFAKMLRKFGLGKDNTNLGGYTGLLAYSVLRNSKANYRSERSYFMASPQKSRLAGINEYLERYLNNTDFVDYVRSQSQLDDAMDELRLAGVHFDNPEQEETYRRLYAVGLLARHTAPQEFKNNITAVMAETIGNIELTPEVGSYLREHPQDAEVIFYALSQTHEPTREAIGGYTFKNSLMRRKNNLSTNYLDNVFYWFGEKFAQALDNKRDLKDKNALALLDAAVASMVKSEDKKVISGYSQVIDKANNAVVQAVDNTLTYVWNKLPGTNVHKASDLKEVHDDALKFVGKHFSEGFRDIAKDIFGRNKTTDAIYTTLKRAKTYVQQHRQAAYDNGIKLTQECFKKSLNERQWKALDNTFGRINLTALSVNEAFSLFANPRSLDDAISKIEGRFSDRQLQRIRDLVTFLQEKKLPPASRPLFKNAYAMAHVKDWKDKKAKPATTNDFARAIALYNLRAISPENRAALQDINDNEGIKKVMSIQRNVQATIMDELLKFEGNGRMNYLEGDLARNKTNEKQVNIFPTRDDHKLKQLGYHKVKDVGSGYAFYARDFTPRSVFNQGAIQTIAPASGNVNLYSGINYNANFTGYIPKGAVPEGLPFLVPVYNDSGRVIAYEGVLPGYNEVKHNLSETIAYNYGKQIESETASVMNNALLDQLLDMYTKDNDKGAFVNAFDVAKKDKVVARAVQNIPRPMLEAMKARTGRANFFPVRRDMINDVIGEHLPSVGDVFTGQSRWSPKMQHATVRYLTALMGPNAYRKLTHAEEKWQDTVRAAREIIVIKSIAVPVVNATSNVVQLVMNGVDPLYIARETPKKISELETYIRAQKRTKALRARIKLGVDTPTEANRHQREIDMLNRRIKSLSIFPLIERGEFSTVDDVGISQEDVELLHDATGYIEQKIAQMDDNLVKDILRYGFITKDTPLYQGLEKLNQYSDFVSKALLYDTLMARGRNKQDALVYVADEFVDYDRLTGRNRGYLESVGALMFYNYVLRATKAGVRSFVVNPLRLAMLYFSPLSPLDVGFAAGDSLLGRATVGTMNLTGLDEVVSAPLNIPAAAIAF